MKRPAEYSNHLGIFSEAGKLDSMSHDAPELLDLPEQQENHRLPLGKLVILATLAWSAIIIMNTMVNWVDAVRDEREVDLFARFSLYLIGYGAWIPISTLLYRHLEQALMSEGKLNLFRQYMGAMLVILPIYMVIDFAFFTHQRNIEWNSLTDLFMQIPAFYVFFDWLLFTLVFGICVAIIYYRNAEAKSREQLRLSRETAELARQLSELKLSALKAQLEPHFLFNALNSISALIRIEEKEAAQEAVRQLSDLLRYAVEANQHALIPLTNELRFAEEYLALQRLRYDERLNLNWRVGDVPGSLECPPFILHTLLENAIAHGVENNPEPTEVIVDVSVGDELIIKVTNCPGSEAGRQTESLGTGLNRLREQLTLVYGDEAKLELLNQPECFKAEVVLPLEAGE